MYTYAYIYMYIYLYVYVYIHNIYLNIHYHRSVKAASDVYSPVSGTVIEVNTVS
jgi:hypothetical protein